VRQQYGLGAAPEQLSSVVRQRLWDRGSRCVQSLSMVKSRRLKRAGSRSTSISTILPPLTVKPMTENGSRPRRQETIPAAPFTRMCCTEWARCLITLPLAFNTGPPLLTGDIGAVICMKSSCWSLRRALIMPWENGMRAFSPSHTINLTPHSGRQRLKLEVNTRFLLKTRNNLEQVFGVRIS